MKRSLEKHTRFFEYTARRWALGKTLTADEPTTWTQMLQMCGQVHGVTLADLRESLVPRPVAYARGDTSGGRRADRDESKQSQKGSGKGLSANVKKQLVKQLTDSGVSNAQDIVDKLGKGKGKKKRQPKADPKKRPRGKGDDKGKGNAPKRQKSDIECRFWKKGKGTCRAGDKCEYKHST